MVGGGGRWLAGVRCKPSAHGVDPRHWVIGGRQREDLVGAHHREASALVVRIEDPHRDRQRWRGRHRG